MKDFKYLDEKTIELAGIAASIAGGCRLCLDYHFKKALEVGCNLDQVKEAIERSIPTQVFLDLNGKEYFRHIGFFPEEDVVTVLKMKGIK